MPPTPLICSGATAATPTRFTTRIFRQFSLAFTRDRLQSGKFLWFFWFLARFLVLMIWAVVTPGTQGDVIYYFQKIQVVFHQGPQYALQEYPTPVIWILVIPYLLGFGTQRGYVIVFVLMMLALDALFSWSLWHTGGSMRGQAIVFWTIFLLLAGPTAYLRFDLITSVLMGWSLVFLLRRHNATAGGLTALGASVKLWPALLWPALLPGSFRQKLRASIGFIGTGIALVGLSLLFAGKTRLLSPLSWQQGRGLQVESIWATPAMLARLFMPNTYAVTMSRYQAFEIWGPLVNTLIKLSDISLAVGLLLAAIAYVVWLWRGHGRLIEAVALVQFVILIMLVTNKTFSPQYLIWLGGPQAAAFAVLGSRSQHVSGFYSARSRLNSLSVWMIVATALTLIVYPLNYGFLVNDTGVSGTVPRIIVTLLLAARNVVVVILLVGVARWVWSFLKPKVLRQVRLGSREDAKVDSTLDASSNSR